LAVAVVASSGGASSGSATQQQQRRKTMGVSNMGRRGCAQSHMYPYVLFILLILYFTECKLFFKTLNCIQIKNFPNTKFYNFFRSTTFIRGRLQNLIFKFERFKFSFSFTIRFQIKLQSFILFRIYNFYLIVSPFEVIWKIQIFKFEKFIHIFRCRK
jgi:hypothetical protein